MVSIGSGFDGNLGKATRKVHRESIFEGAPENKIRKVNQEPGLARPH
jgi:hypothetical protein